LFNAVDMTASSPDFDNNRAQSRRLEKQIYAKLNELSKLNLGVVRQVQTSISIGPPSAGNGLFDDAVSVPKTIEALLDKVGKC
jgi:hypothetical protein